MRVRDKGKGYGKWKRDTCRKEKEIDMGVERGGWQEMKKRGWWEKKRYMWLKAYCKGNKRVMGRKKREWWERKNVGDGKENKWLSDLIGRERREWVK